MRRSVGFAAVAAAAVLATILGASPNAVGEPSPIEAQFVALINSHRAGLGLAPYEVHPQLEAKARAWSETMADAGDIFHSRLPDGITAPWQSLGENVAMGPSIGLLHNALVTSPRHLANFVHTGYRFVGVGVFERSGTIYVTQEFMQLQAAASATPPATPTKSQAAPPRDPEPAPPTTAVTEPPAEVKPPQPPPVAAPDKDPAAERAGGLNLPPGQPLSAEPVLDPSIAMTPATTLSPAEGVSVPTSAEPGPAVAEVLSDDPVPHPPARAAEEAAAGRATALASDRVGDNGPRHVAFALGFFLLGTGVGLVGALHSARATDRAIDRAIDRAGRSRDPVPSAQGPSETSSRRAPLSPETLDDRLAEAMSFLGLGGPQVRQPDPGHQTERASQPSRVGNR